MSISSIPSSPPVHPAAAGAPKAPDPPVDGDADDAGAAQPPVQASLPPGQGTRVNQLV